MQNGVCVCMCKSIGAGQGADELVGPHCRVPYVVIIKKHYPNRRKISGKRRWQLKKLAKVQDGGITKRDEEKEEQDFEMFMRDIEEDKELRSMINLYRSMCFVGSGSGEETEKSDVLSRVLRV